MIALVAVSVVQRKGGDSLPGICVDQLFAGVRSGVVFLMMFVIVVGLLLVLVVFLMVSALSIFVLTGESFTALLLLLLLLVVILLLMSLVVIVLLLWPIMTESVLRLIGSHIVRRRMFVMLRLTVLIQLWSIVPVVVRR